MTAVKLGLVRKDFNLKTGKTFSSLFGDKAFSDVTLVCNDNHHIQAHKVILSSGSHFFRDLLLANPHPHPLVYLRVTLVHLDALVKFLYLGQCQVDQEDIDTFLKLARELKMEGLTQEGEEENGEGTEFVALKEEDTSEDNEQIINNEETKSEVHELSNRGVHVLSDTLQNGKLDENKCASKILLQSKIHYLDSPRTYSNKESVYPDKELVDARIYEHKESVDISIYKDKELVDASINQNNESAEEDEVMFYKLKSWGYHAYDKFDFAYKMVTSKPSKGTVNYKCLDKSCPATILVKNKNKIFRRNWEHKHEPMTAEIEMRKLESDLLDEAVKRPAKGRLEWLLAAIQDGTTSPAMAALATPELSLKRTLSRRCREQDGPICRPKQGKVVFPEDGECMYFYPTQHGQQAYDRHHFAYKLRTSKAKEGSTTKRIYLKCLDEACSVLVVTENSWIAYRRGEHGHAPMTDLVQTGRQLAERNPAWGSSRQCLK